MNINKLSLTEAIFFILIITINRLAINIPQAIILSCGSSAILNIIYISVIAIVATMIIVKLFKFFPSSNILDVSKFLGGNIFKNIVGIFLFVYILVIASVLLRDFAETIHIIYYTDAPIIYLLLFFVAVCAIANLLGNNSIFKTNVILTTIMIISLLISFSSVIPNLTVQRALPILGYGIKNTFITGLANLFAFNGLLVLYFVPPFLKNPKDFKKASIIAVIISSVLMVLATTCILLAFSFSANIEKISSLYMILSNNEFGKYLQHPESLFVFTWILSFMTYLNVTCVLLVQIAKGITNVRNSKPFVIPVCILILIVAMIPKNIMQVRSIGTYISEYVAIPLTFVVLPIILVFANIKHKRLNKSRLEKS